ncbi:YceH family protein [Ferribacterium limneticum]|uniref:YceH family protein n=1 Tax=Ferribacterium limneticum TaxID=76259 RepID=UPI001CFC0801|nr:YceH family protein [Ferribacterium limneticum]UCV30029.1 YceH family protein [Ferribacterium limneticum]UCV33948.1 YceH family protein [Ferribacterium limneticum]
MAESTPMLSLLETRILGTLVEKQRTVPDTYPLSVNALMAGCNQKTSRNPVIETSEAEILVALDRLKDLGLVREVSGSRVSRFEHLFEKSFGVPTQASALLTVLMLRGPQTAGELRLNCERLHRFADISSVEAFLEELAAKEEGALVVELPRLLGSRENRWMHLLSGQPVIEATPVGRSPAAGAQDIEELRARVSSLEAEVAELRALLLNRSHE